MAQIHARRCWRDRDTAKPGTIRSSHAREATSVRAGVQGGGAARSAARTIINAATCSNYSIINGRRNFHATAFISIYSGGRCACRRGTVRHAESQAASPPPGEERRLAVAGKRAARLVVPVDEPAIQWRRAVVMVLCSPS